MVFLHGVLDAPDAWRGVAERAREAGFEALLVHARAHGASPEWSRGMDWSPLADAQEVAALLDAVAPGGAHVVGHSRGATSASWLAVERADLARSLAVVASPPVASEVFRAHFRRLASRARSPREEEALAYLSAIPDDDFPQHALRRYDGRALVVEAGGDALYSPTHTMFWRLFLPYARFERVEGAHRFFAEREEDAAWLARVLVEHFAGAETA